MDDKQYENAERFLNAYASIERSLNRQLCKNDYMPFKKLVSLAAKNNIRSRMRRRTEYFFPIMNN